MITLEQVKDGYIIDGLRKGRIEFVREDYAFAMEQMNQEGCFYPYELVRIPPARFKDLAHDLSYGVYRFKVVEWGSEGSNATTS